jgi:hypothetical protein
LWQWSIHRPGLAASKSTVTRSPGRAIDGHALVHDQPVGPVWGNRAQVDVGSGLQVVGGEPVGVGDRQAMAAQGQPERRVCGRVDDPKPDPAPGRAAKSLAPGPCSRSAGMLSGGWL